MGESPEIQASSGWFVSFLEKSLLNIPDVNEINVGDVDGDGDIDLMLFSTSQNLIWVSKGDGRGNFSIPKRLGFNSSKKEVFFGEQLLVGDFDGDGRADFLYIEEKPIASMANHLKPTRNYRDYFLVSSSLAPDGSMQRGFSYQLGDRFHKHRSRLRLLYGDVNRDYRMDIIFVDTFLNSIFSVVNAPDLWHKSASSLNAESKKGRSGGQQYFIHGKPLFLLAFDMDHDGYTDIVRIGERQIYISRGGKGGSFLAPAEALSHSGIPADHRGFLVGSRSIVRHGHMDRDNLPDLIVLDTSGHVLGFRNNDGKVFRKWFLLDYGEYSSMQLGDFNGDGLDDIVLWGEASEALEILINGGDGHFIKSARRPLGGKIINALRVADVNDDMLADIIVTVHNYQKSADIKILLNITQNAYQ